MTASRIAIPVFALIALLAVAPANAAPFDGLTRAHADRAAANFQQYCALCHGADRQGHVNDHAPSLRSKSLLSAGYYERVMAVAYGRLGTPMAGFLDEVGGPVGQLVTVHGELVRERDEAVGEEQRLRHHRERDDADEAEDELELQPRLGQPDAALLVAGGDGRGVWGFGGSHGSHVVLEEGEP